MRIRPLALAAVLASVAGLAVGALPAQATSDGFWDYEPVSLRGVYLTAAADFGGDAATDVLFYSPGAPADALWLGRDGVRGTAGFQKLSLSIPFDATPVVGDFAGDAHADIFWYGPGAATDQLWVSDGDGTFTAHASKVSGYFTPKALTDVGPGKDDILWYGSTGNSFRWQFSSTGDGTVTSRVLALPNRAKPKRALPIRALPCLPCACSCRDHLHVAGLVDLEGAEVAFLLRAPLADPDTHAAGLQQ